MANKKLKRLLPLIIIAQPTTTKEGINEYRRIRRRMNELEKKNYFRFDKILDELDKEIKKSLKEIGLVPM